MPRRSPIGLAATLLVCSAAIATPSLATAGIFVGLKNRQVVDVEQIATPTGVRPVVDTVLVKFRNDYPVRVRASARSAAFDKAGADPKGARKVAGLPGVWQVPVDEGASPGAVARRLDARADVAWAVRDAPGTLETPPNDPLFSNLWGLSNTGQQVQAPTPFTGLAGVDLGALGAWATTRMCSPCRPV